MAMINVIGLQEIQNRYRIEAEFYRSNYIDCYKAIESLPHLKLRQNCLKITDGTHFTPTYVNSGIKFFSAINVQENIFVYDDFYKFITLQEHQKIYKRCPVQSRDVLIRKVGVGPRWSCVVPDTIEPFSIFVSVALVRPNKKLLPHYLSTFINSKYGQLQLLRLNKGISQPDLHLEDIGELLVPQFTPEIQSHISHIVLSAQEKRTESKQLYTHAQQILESELRLDKLYLYKPVGYPAQSSITYLTNTFYTNRIDAQCFSPTAVFYGDWLLKHARCDRLSSLLSSVAKGRQQTESENGITNYCSIKHISEHEIINASKTTANYSTTNATRNDLLLAITGATIGKIGIVNQYDNLLFSGDMLRLRVNSCINPYYLLLVLDHQLGQVQFSRWITGSTNGHLSPKDVNKVLVPRLTNKKEEAIAQLIIDSFKKRQESDALLEQAKEYIEQLIEETIHSG